MADDVDDLDEFLAIAGEEFEESKESEALQYTSYILPKIRLRHLSFIND